jgi:hypothetical protein
VDSSGPGERFLNLLASSQRTGGLLDAILSKHDCG